MYVETAKRTNIEIKAIVANIFFPVLQVVSINTSLYYTRILKFALFVNTNNPTKDNKEISMNKLKKLPISAWLPVLLLVALGIFMLVWVFWQAGSYGQTMDEPLRDAYGQSVLGWYKSLGRDMSFITAYPAFEYEPQHGAIFDVIAVIFERIFKHYWYTHAVIIGLSGVVGVVAIALCGYELGGPWAALLAALGLWLYPRYFGAIFNNPKDVPFTTAMTWVLWSVLLLMKRWESKKYFWYAALTGVLIGIAASIRVTAVIWYPILLLMLYGGFAKVGLQALREGKSELLLRKAVYAGIVIGFASLLAMIILWPYITLNPLSHLIESIQVMSKYPWNGTVLFAGKTYAAADIPRWYAPWWLVIGSPPVLVLCFALGCLKIGFSFAKNHFIDARLAVVAMAFFVPLIAIVAMHSVLYGSLRQFLFLVPPMILIAAYVVVWACRVCVKYWIKGLPLLLITGLLLSYALVVRDMARLYPYEYVYFSPIVGGLPGAANSYETDYWGSCQASSAQWLASNYRRYTKKQHPTVEGIVDFESLITMHLPSNFRVDEKTPDFVVVPLGVNKDAMYMSYRIVHTVKRQDIALCIVKVK